MLLRAQIHDQFSEVLHVDSLKTLKEIQAFVTDYKLKDSFIVLVYTFLNQSRPVLQSFRLFLPLVAAFSRQHLQIELSTAAFGISVLLEFGSNGN